jgi:hypothetical protein
MQSGMRVSGWIVAKKRRLVAKHAVELLIVQRVLYNKGGLLPIMGQPVDALDGENSGSTRWFV